MTTQMSSRKLLYIRENIDPDTQVNLNSLILRSGIQKSKFQESINLKSLTFKNPSTEDLYRKYFDKNCEENHFGYYMIFAIDIINLILELVYVCRNYSCVSAIEIFLWIFFKLSALSLQLLSIFHHYMKCIEFFFDYIPFFSPVLGDLGFTFFHETENNRIHGFMAFICFTTSIQFIFVIYTRFRNFIPSLISFIICFIGFYLSFDLTYLIPPSYELIRIAGFLAFLIICIIFMYNINANQRRSFFDLYLISLEFINQQEILASIPFSIIIANNKKILYLNGTTFDLFNIPKNNFEDDLSRFTVIQKDSLEPISLLYFLKNFHSKENTYYCSFLSNNRKQKFEVTQIKSTFDGEDCFLTSFKDITLIQEQNREEVQKKFEILIIGSMTHNFRTPINCILGSVEFALNIIKDIPTNLHKILSKVKQQGRILLDIVDSNHEYFFYKNNQLTLNTILFDPREIISSITELYEDELNEKKNSHITKFF